MRLGALLAVWAITGCYAPVIPSGAPCGEGGQCPRGLECDPATHLCVGMIGPDAALDTASDASPCDPTEVYAAGACVVPLVAEVTPAPISASACTTGNASVARSVALDASNRIYAVYRCGATNSGFVVVSEDGGATVTAPTPLQTELTGIAVQGGPRKVAYVALAGSGGTAIAVTADGGASWTTTMLDTSVPAAGWGVSVAAAGDSVYVAAQIGASSSVRVWRNASRGVGAFDATDVAIGSVFGDVLADPQTGDVWVAGDTPSLHVRRSQDGGATFAPVIDPAASYGYSDWSIGAGSIFATGSNLATFTKLSTSDPTMVTAVDAMLPSSTARGRAISARGDGAVYVANDNGAGALTFLRVAPGATTATPRTAGPGSGPSMVPGPDTAAPVVFTDTATTKVHLGVVVF